MRQVCPYCSQAVDVPDSAAGTEAPCPACGKPFAVPKAYTPNVSVPVEKPTPPPGLVPPAPPVQQTATVSGLHDECGLTLSPQVIAWIPALALTVALASALFFSWIGSFPGGFRAFTQSPLQALFADFSVQSFASLQDTEKGLNSSIRSNWLMLPFLLLLILVTLFAWFERFFPDPKLGRVPSALSFLVGFWPRRHFVLIGMTFFALLFMYMQCYRGFALENALKEISTQKYAKELDEADTTHARQDVQVRAGQDFGRYCLQYTTANVVGHAMLWLALVMLILDCWLDRRAGKPAPRIVLKS